MVAKLPDQSPARLQLEYDWSVAALICGRGGFQGPCKRNAGPTDPPIALQTVTLHAVRESKVTVKIPRPLYRKIQLVVEGSGFSSPTDFIVFVLRDLMGDTPAAKVDPEAGLVPEADARELTQAELDDVRRKLENLGYL